MGGQSNYIRRIPRRFKKVFTFDGETGSGAAGTVAVGTVTGSILFSHLTARVKTTLVGAATIEMGVAGATALLIAQLANATTLAAGDWWTGANSPAGVGGAIIDKAVVGDIIITVASTDITEGVIEVVGFWLPLSDDGHLA